MSHDGDSVAGRLRVGASLIAIGNYPRHRRRMPEILGRYLMLSPECRQTSEIECCD